MRPKSRGGVSERATRALFALRRKGALEFFIGWSPLWVLLVCMSALFVTLHLPLRREQVAMLGVKEKLLEDQERLKGKIVRYKKRIARHGDPSWQEMVLIRQLNLCPVGWNKWCLEGEERP